MNSTARRMLMERMHGEDYWEYNPAEDEPFMRGKEMRERDGRRGVRGTGPYGIGGRRYYGRRDRRSSGDYADEDMARGGNRGGRDRLPGPDPDPRLWRRYGEEDGTDINYNDSADYADYGEEIHLKKEDLKHWKKSLENADGTMGEHFTMEQIMGAAEKLGVKFEEYDEKEFCLVVNMLYSDYCEALKGIIPQDKELHAYVKMAKAWLEDEDALQGSERLAMYYYCIVEAAEEDDEDFRRRDRRRR